MNEKNIVSQHIGSMLCRLLFSLYKSKGKKADGAMCLDLIGYADLEGWRCP